MLNLQRELSWRARIGVESTSSSGDRTTTCWARCGRIPRMAVIGRKGLSCSIFRATDRLGETIWDSMSHFVGFLPQFPRACTYHVLTFVDHNLSATLISEFPCRPHWTKNSRDVLTQSVKNLDSGVSGFETRYVIRLTAYVAASQTICSCTREVRPRRHLQECCWRDHWRYISVRLETAVALSSLQIIVGSSSSAPFAYSRQKQVSRESKCPFHQLPDFRMGNIPKLPFLLAKFVWKKEQE